MVGLILVLMYFGASYFLFGNDLIATYQASTNFLFWWYVFFAAIIALVSLIIIILSALGIGAISAGELGPFGGVLGFIGGGTTVSFFLAVRFMMTYGCLLFGTHLMRIAWTGESWDSARLGFGVLLLLVGIITSRSRSSSSD